MVVTLQTPTNTRFFMGLQVLVRAFWRRWSLVVLACFVLAGCTSLSNSPHSKDGAGNNSHRCGESNRENTHEPDVKGNNVGLREIKTLLAVFQKMRSEERGWSKTLERDVSSFDSLPLDTHLLVVEMPTYVQLGPEHYLFWDSTLVTSKHEIVSGLLQSMPVEIRPDKYLYVTSIWKEGTSLQVESCIVRHVVNEQSADPWKRDKTYLALSVDYVGDTLKVTCRGISNN